jgi:hypothetical protein
MHRSAPLVALAALLGACAGPSSLELTLRIQEATLEGVEQFPVRLLVDVGQPLNREIHICDWDAGFLETTIEIGGYDPCPVDTEIEAVLVPLTDVCTDIVGQNQDWPERGTVIYGQGSETIFQAAACEITEIRTLTVAPFEL